MVLEICRSCNVDEMLAIDFSDQAYLIHEIVSSEIRGHCPSRVVVCWTVVPDSSFRTRIGVIKPGSPLLEHNLYQQYANNSDSHPRTRHLHR